MSMRNSSTHRIFHTVRALGLLLLWSAGSWAVSSQIAATLIDRYGNKHEVEKLVYQGRLDLEYYVDGQRRVVALKDIDRLRFEGEREDEEQAVTVTLHTGKVEPGRMLTGAGLALHQDAQGGGGSAERFAGTTSLGPFFILASDVRELIIRHSDADEPVEDRVIKATFITLDGQRWEVSDVRFRGKERLDYNIGHKRRFVSLDKVERIDFAEGSTGAEIRPITITYWSGRAVQGAVDASTVRLSGETDKSFYERVNTAFTGKTANGVFNIGMHAIKQIRFHRQKGEEEGDAEETGSGDQAPTEP